MINRGMMIVIPPAHWSIFRDMTLPDLAMWLKDLAAQVELKRFLKHPRKKKKKKAPLVADAKHPHVSTAKLLAREK